MPREFRALVSPEEKAELVARLREARDKHLARPDYQEPTFRCPICCDSGFLVRDDSKGRVFGSRCECLHRAAEDYRKLHALPFKGGASERPIEDGDLPF